MKIFIGSLIGFFIGAMIWFPYGIWYAVQASDSSALVSTIAVIKGVFSLWTR
jgi:hypothetical protein